MLQRWADRCGSSGEATLGVPGPGVPGPARSSSRTRTSPLRRAKMTTRACRWAIQQIRREHASVNGIRRRLGTGWRTVWESIMPLLQKADQDPSRFENVTILGVDEHAWHLDLSEVTHAHAARGLSDRVIGRSLFEQVRAPVAVSRKRPTLKHEGAVARPGDCVDVGERTHSLVGIMYVIWGDCRLRRGRLRRSSTGQGRHLSVRRRGPGGWVSRWGA